MNNEIDRKYLRRLAGRECAQYSEMLVALEHMEHISPEDRIIIKRHYEKQKQIAERHYHLLGQ